MILQNRQQSYYSTKLSLLCILFAISSLLAGEKNLSLSYGFFNLTGGSIVGGNAIADLLGAEEDKDDVNLLSLSSFNVSYGYELWEKFEIGSILTYSYLSSGYNIHSITIKPKTKINWIYKSGFRFYSLLAIGPTFYFNSEKFGTKAFWQATLIGFEFGKFTSFFFELGVGQVGGFVTGIKIEL